MEFDFTDHLHRSIMTVARTDVATLNEDLTIHQALDTIRAQGVGEKIVYFYVVDDDNVLKGVIPTRRLLTAPLDTKIRKVMIRNVVTLPTTATILHALELFALRRFLAFPIVDVQKHVIGVVDIGMFAEENFELAEREHVEELFSSIGFRLSQVRDASAFKAFRIRFPWLVSTIISGSICAILAGYYEMTLAQSLIIAFFLTLVLGLGESVSMQSMMMTIHAIRSKKPTLKWFIKAFRRELGTSFLLGLSCGFAVGLVAWFWKRMIFVALAIGGSIILTLIAACLFGLCVPVVLHALKLDIKIAAGPITLALSDIATILIYLSVATAVLRG